MYIEVFNDVTFAALNKNFVVKAFSTAFYDRKRKFEDVAKRFNFNFGFLGIYWYLLRSGTTYAIGQFTPFKVTACFVSLSALFVFVLK